LKPESRLKLTIRSLVSPGLTAGGGLKPELLATLLKWLVFPPASPPGAD